jgi:hypothetical protein
LSFLRVIVWVGRRVVGGGHSVVDVVDTVRLMWRTQRGWDAGHGAVGCGELGMGEIKMVGEGGL